jgi:ABC-2 type transport system permease protein
VTAVSQCLGGVCATIKRDARVFRSYRLRAITQFATMILTMTMFYYIGKLVRPGVVGPHSQYFAFAIVGIVGLAILTAALNLSQIVRMELLAGTFERVVISPLGPLWGAVSLAAFPILYAIGFAGLTLAVASSLFGFPVELAGIPAALAVSALAAVAFACIGLVFVGVLLAFKSASAATWVIAALSILGGVYFPVALFPSWVRWISEVQPFTPAVELLRHLLLGTTPSQAVWLELAKLAGFTAVLVPISGAVLWLAISVSRSRGTILEY